MKKKSRRPLNRRGGICFCETCEKEYNSLGIASHRAMHRRKGEDCTIEMNDGAVYTWHYSKPRKAKT